MDVNSDRKFLRQFSGVIVGFMVLTIALIFLARYIEPEPGQDDNPSQAILAEQRVAPVGAVRSGEAGAAARLQPFRLHLLKKWSWMGQRFTAACARLVTMRAWRALR